MGNCFQLIFLLEIYKEFVMPRIRFIHWKPSEAENLVNKLKTAGFNVEFEPFSNKIMQADRETPPDVIVIDLNRIPSQGRDLGITYRTYKGTRLCPIVFVGGDPKKVADIRTILPDAHYATWSNINEAIDLAISTPSLDPVVPDSRMQGYAGAPLTKKLGIKEDSVVALVDAPEGFEKTLGVLPSGVRLRKSARGKSDLTLWFITTQKGLQKRIGKMGTRAGNGGLWIIWPKKASGLSSDLTQNVVRQTGLDAGLVDFKIASIDDTWSGLRFTIRKK
jgi:CheY-like chemotaxis protein